MFNKSNSPCVVFESSFVSLHRKLQVLKVNQKRKYQKRRFNYIFLKKGKQTSFGLKERKMRTLLNLTRSRSLSKEIDRGSIVQSSDSEP